MQDCHVGHMNGSGQSTPWFPDYDPEVEENRGRKWCNWIMMWWLLALVIGSIVCGLFVMRPGVVFQSYEPGQCTLNTLKFDEMKRCSCGKNCQSEYPCYKMTGGFVSNVTKDASTAMSLYNGFWDYDKGCVYTTCGRAESNNIDTIYEKILEFYQAHGYDDSGLPAAMKNPQENTVIDMLDSTKIISCYGNNDGSAFLKYIDSPLMIGLGTIPIILFVIMVVAFIKLATPGMKIVTMRCMCLPYYCITDRETTTTYLCNPRSPCRKGYCCY